MKSLNRSVLLSFAAMLGLFISAGCETAPKGEVAKENLRDESQTTLRELQRLDPTLESFLKDNAYAYAIFPNIGKGGAIVGGAYGHGTVYQGGNFVGWAELNQGSIGLQLGGQTFTEVVVFKDKGTFNEWQHKGEWSAGASASAVALKSGAARNASFYDGVAYLVRPNGGLMVDLSIQGQKFNFRPTSEGEARPATNQDRVIDRRDAEGNRTIERTTTTTDVDGSSTRIEKESSTSTTVSPDSVKEHQDKIGQRSPNGNNAD